MDRLLALLVARRLEPVRLGEVGCLGAEGDIDQTIFLD
ncbi:hypothetical protein C4K39_3660 [Pseudomonas sessilinigenes]|nr:hypothetical protein C4K39_3660 [Pseudomonas sessilinigenes]